MRTFDDIIPPSRRPGGVPPPPAPPPSSPLPRLRRAPRSGRFPFVTLIVAAGIIVVSVAILFYYSGAKVQVVPYVSTASVQSSFTVGGTNSTIPFEIITVKKTATQTVAASGNKHVRAAATGTIMIYNTQSKPQKLVATTRFASSAGLVFRIQSSVSVPAGSTSKPGTISASVYADQPGASYNIAPSSFTLPGLSGTAQASAVYARSNTPMTGGAEGSVSVVDTATEQATVTSLANSLKGDLGPNLQGKVPAGYILLPGAATTTYHELSPAPSTTPGKADIQVEGTLTGIIFPMAQLAKAISTAQGTTDSTGVNVTLGQGTTLTLTPTSAFPSVDTDTFSFTLTGTAVLLSHVDPIQIATAVAGKSEAEARVALTNYPEIKKAVLVLRPFWKQTFPQDPAFITVTVSSPDSGGM